MKKISKTLSVIMAILMVLAVIPMSASAATDTIKLNETKSVTVPAEGYAECKFTPEEDGTYVVYSDMGEANIDPYVGVYDADGNPIASDDDNDYADTYDFYCIFEAEAGADYFLKMYVFEDYTVEFDITVSVFGEITHQPTADEPYVEVTEGADAEYQWCKRGDSIVELTDEYAEPREDGYVGNFATYDSTNGWTGVYSGYEAGINKEYRFFEVMLPEDQTIKMTTDTDAVELGIWCVCGESNEDWEDVNANDTVEFTADHACVYYTWGLCAQVPHLKAEMPEIKKVNTDAELEADEAGTHICIVTFDGCRVEVSDTFEVTEIAVAYPEISLSASASKVDYKSSVELNASVENMPENAKISWFLDGSAFSINADGNTCTATSIDKGTSTITVKILLDDGTYATDANGNVISDSVEITAAYTWWQWIIVIVLFGWIWY